MKGSQFSIYIALLLQGPDGEEGPPGNKGEKGRKGGLGLNGDRGMKGEKGNPVSHSKMEKVNPIFRAPPCEY